MATLDISTELWPVVRLTLELAAVTTVLLLVIGTPIAWWLARATVRWKEAVAAVVALPLVLPPTVWDSNRIAQADLFHPAIYMRQHIPVDDRRSILFGWRAYGTDRTKGPDHTQNGWNLTDIDGQTERPSYEAAQRKAGDLRGSGQHLVRCRPSRYRASGGRPMRASS